jgi:flagellar M-ring protein FliF
MSTVLSGWWAERSQGARVGLAVGTAVLLAAVIWAGVFALRTPYGVLFSDLTEADAGAIVTRLKKSKTPYRLGEGGTTILVPDERVHEIRLDLMSGDVPLSGGVGFEIFDKQGLGATEQSQKVSFQRALQGELARTIGALDTVKQARVHLVMPESSLFTRDRQQASAAVTVATRSGATLAREQIVGIQRLIAAAVPGLEVERVVVTDHRGVTLSGVDTTGAQGAGSAETRLEVKRHIEEYLAHKVGRLLDGAFGPSQAIVSVDATLNFDVTKTTIRDLLPGSAAGTEGRVVRRRQVTSGSANEPLWTTAADSITTSRTPGSSMEVEYEYGQRIDEVIAAPGALSRLSVGVIVPGDLDEERRARIAELVRMASGINEQRGDALSIQSLTQMQQGLLVDEPVVEREVAVSGVTKQEHAASALPMNPRGTSLLIAAIACVLVASLWLYQRRRPRVLSEAERERLLAEIRRSLVSDAAASSSQARS